MFTNIATSSSITCQLIPKIFQFSLKYQEMRNDEEANARNSRHKCLGKFSEVLFFI